jgi:hypothetical protein
MTKSVTGTANVRLRPCSRMGMVYGTLRAGVAGPTANPAPTRPLRHVGDRGQDHPGRFVEGVVPSSMEPVDDNTTGS